MRVSAGLASLILLAASSSQSLAATIRVPADQRTIQAGIDAALTGDTVLVASGTYRGDGNRDIEFRGKAVTVLSEEGRDNTIIDCLGSEFASHRGFHFHGGEGPASVLDGFTATNGWEPRSGGYGGGILCEGASSPTIRNCVLRGDSANDGGGMFCDQSSSPMILGCLFQGNWASVYGGGLYCWNGSSPSLVQCVFQKNLAGEHGGALVLSAQSDPTLTNCTFYGNYAGIDGACIAVLFGTSPATLIGSILSFGTRGRAVFCNPGVAPPVLQCCDVFGNDGGDWVGCISDQAGANGNFSSDPLFCDPEGGDLRVQAQSPCIAPQLNPACGLLVGALGAGCGPPAYDCGNPQVRCVPSEYASISDALDSAVAGDTILVSRGIYTETSLTMKPGVLVTGEPGAPRPVIQASAGPIVFLPIGTDSTTVLRDFTLDGLGRASPGIRCASSGARIEGNEIRNMSEAALVTGGMGPSFVGNNVHDCDEGIQILGPGTTIVAGDTIFGIHGTGIEIDSSATKLRGNFISHCRVGIRSVGRPQPEIGGDISRANAIYDNQDWNLDNAMVDTLVATCNYWGSMEESEIASTLNGPVQFVPFADSDLISCGATSVPAAGPAQGEADTAFHLATPAPNPARSGVVLRFGLPASVPVHVRIYDVNGRLVRRLVDRVMSAGTHAEVWDGRDDQGKKVPSGIYFCRLEAAGRSAVRKSLLTE